MSGQNSEYRVPIEHSYSNIVWETKWGDGQYIIHGLYVYFFSFCIVQQQIVNVTKLMKTTIISITTDIDPATANNKILYGFG